MFTDESNMYIHLSLHKQMINSKYMTHVRIAWNY